MHRQYKKSNHQIHHGEITVEPNHQQWQNYYWTLTRNERGAGVQDWSKEGGRKKIRNLEDKGNNGWCNGWSQQNKQIWHMMFAKFILGSSFLECLLVASFPGLYCWFCVQHPQRTTWYKLDTKRSVVLMSQINHVITMESSIQQWKCTAPVATLAPFGKCLT